AHDARGVLRRHLHAAGVRPSEIRAPADLAAVPPIRKDDLRANEAERPPIGDYRAVGLEGAIRLATSTGTTGRPTFTLWTAADLRLDYELAARAHWRAGLRPGQVVVNAHPGYLNGGEAMNAGGHEDLGLLPLFGGAAG